MSASTPASLSRGFSLVELLIALAVSVLVTAAVFSMLASSSGAFQVQPEAADVQQRLRAATDAIAGDLLAAGGGSAAAVFPMRVGRRSPDAAGTFDPTRISFLAISQTGAQATLAAPLQSASGTATIASGPLCADGDATCGFRSGATVAVLSHSGAWDLFSVSNVQGNLLTLQHNLRDSALVYPAGEAVIADATMRTYFLREDRASGSAQLMRYDGAGGADVPVVDHLVGLTFEYLGDAEPPSLVPGTEPPEPLRVTYGPLPPDAGMQPTAYPAGENCVFARTAAGAVVSRLPQLAAGPVLVPLPASALTDGPWCPDAASPNRYDADLLRLRQVTVSLRIEAAVTALRGPAGPLFSRGGTARGTRLVPDRTARLVLAPRPLNGAR